MKRNMVEAHIINQHLMRTIAALEWKQVIEYGKAKLKSVLIENQEVKTIASFANKSSVYSYKIALKWSINALRISITFSRLTAR
jgi:hypothetical protein